MSQTKTQLLGDVSGGANFSGIVTSSNFNSSGISTVTNRLDVKSSDSIPSRVDFYCEVGNIHYTRVQAAPHSEYSGNATVILPTISGDIIIGDSSSSITQNINTTGIVTASSFVGNLTGNVAGNATGLTGSPDITVGVATASSFVGDLTGDATGLSGTPNIVVGFTTVGTALSLTGYYVENITAMGALDVDCSTANYFTKTINGNSTFTFSNVPSGSAYSFTLELTHTSGTVTWPTEVKWPADTAPTLTTGKTHIFIFITDDGGTRWRGSSLVDYTN